jgi:hemerythrin-like metal-binding protein
VNRLRTRLKEQPLRRFHLQTGTCRATEFCCPPIPLSRRAKNNMRWLEKLGWGEAGVEEAGVSFFSWSESMCVGISLLDEDHEIIIGLNIRLERGLERQDDATALADLCRRLLAFNEVHFAREERIMEACGYADLQSHREDHKRFLRGFYAFMDRYAVSPDRIVLREILSYVREWVEQHVLIDDARMGAYLARHQCAHEVAKTIGRLESAVAHRR